MKAILNIILTPFKMIWGIFDNDAHRIMSKKGLNFVEISVKLDKQLAKETTESLTEWIESKRDEDIERWAETARTKINQIVYCCSGENEEHIFDIGFIEGYEKAKADYESLECVNCDEVKETHQICMDCIGKLIKENQETLYTEEQAREIWRASQEYWKTSGASITFEELTEKLKQK